MRYIHCLGVVVCMIGTLLSLTCEAQEEKGGSEIIESTPVSSAPPPVFEIRLSGKKLLGTVAGTKKLFTTLPVGEEVIIDVMLPQEVKYVSRIAIEPRISITQGGVTFVHETKMLTLLPERRVLSKPGPDFPERELKLGCPQRELFIATESRFTLSLNCADSTSGEKLSHRDYGVIKFPVRKEGTHMVARVRVKLSKDFEGKLGAWKYISYSYLF